jgi:hypothetical protein
VRPINFAFILLFLVAVQILSEVKRPKDGIQLFCIKKEIFNPEPGSNSRKPNLKLIMAGLLARPVFDAFPSGSCRTVAKDFQKRYFGLTAAGTAPDLHGIPSLYRQKKFLTINRNRSAILSVFNQFCWFEL